MAADRQIEVDALYKQAQHILLHEMTEDELALVDELGWDNHSTLSDERLSRLKELVRKKGNRPGVA